MKKILLLAFALWGWGASAQVYQKGQTVVYLGTAINESLSYDYWTFRDFRLPPAFHLKVEQGITNRFSFSLSSTHFFYQVQPNLMMDTMEFFFRVGRPYEYSNRFQKYAYSVVPKIQYHSRFNKRINGYVGFGLGVRGYKASFFKSPVERIDDQDHWLTAEFNLGLRVKMSSQWQAYADAGFGPTALSAGLVYCIPRK